MRKLFVACLVLSLFACRNNQARTTAQVEPNVQEVIETVKVAENAKPEIDHSVFSDSRLGTSFVSLVDEGNCACLFCVHWNELDYHDANIRSKHRPIRQGWREVLYEGSCYFDSYIERRDNLKMMYLKGNVERVELWMPNNSKPSRVYKFDSRGNVAECKDYNKDGSLKLDHKYKYNMRGDLLEHSNDRYKCVYKYGKNGKLKWGKSGSVGGSGNYYDYFDSLQHLSLRAVFYDSNGNKIIESAHEGGDSTPMDTYCAYNSKGLLTKVVTDLGAFLAGEEDLKSPVAYCNNQLKKNGSKVIYKFDSKGRIVKVLYKNSDELFGDQYPKECRYSYDARGNLVKRVFSYENAPDRTYKYKYDRAGRLIELEDGGGCIGPIKLLFKYDSRGNVIKKSYQDLASGAIKTIVEYKIVYRK